jgi:hypothetical protein
MAGNQYSAEQAAPPFSPLGRVTTGGGSPIEDAEVRLKEASGRHGVTDENGIATISLREEEFAKLLTKPDDPNVTDKTEGDVTFEITKADYGPIPALGGAFASGPVNALSTVSRSNSSFAESARGVERITIQDAANKKPSTQRALCVAMLKSATQGKDEPGIAVRRLSNNHSNDRGAHINHLHVQLGRTFPPT